MGGDFFQVIPNDADSSLLIVAGDVMGKGLQAGMLVALLVGAIRTAASFNTDPRFVLDQLNHRLLGSNNAQATCLALRIGEDGAVTLANAGHMAPYLNGELMPVEGRAAAGDAAGGGVFGDALQAEGERQAGTAFGRGGGSDGRRGASVRIRAGARVAAFGPVRRQKWHSAAQSFGQEDDISVISVTRTAVMEAVPA